MSTITANAWVTNSGQIIVGVHDAEQCAGEPCVIHNPTDHHMTDWPHNWRNDRHIMERICPHGIGHPDPDDNNEHTVHGCDGCCTPPAKADA